ncbi:MAG: metal ABC transporter substrate-binding protein, partial [Chloroflexota bacterium]|nr:metal ABC transporter substrate-binding protein [Chloroflexota bacterium]
MLRPARVVLLVASVLAAATACGSSPAAERRDDGRDDTVQIVTGFYPLQWVSEQVAGSRAEVTNLTRPGGEPHDLELGPREVARIGEADLVVYLAGFQPAVDEAVQQ